MCRKTTRTRQDTTGSGERDSGTGGQEEGPGKTCSATEWYSARGGSGTVPAGRLSSSLAFSVGSYLSPAPTGLSALHLAYIGTELTTVGWPDSDANAQRFRVISRTASRRFGKTIRQHTGAIHRIIAIHHNITSSFIVVKRTLNLHNLTCRTATM